eukprot:scaffold26028_cov57-Phaeocystis_antarctica.AAC.2
MATAAAGSSPSSAHTHTHTPRLCSNHQRNFLSCRTEHLAGHNRSSSAHAYGDTHPHTLSHNSRPGTSRLRDDGNARSS